MLDWLASVIALKVPCSTCIFELLYFLVARVAQIFAMCTWDSGSFVYQGKQSRRSWRAAATQNMDRAFTWPCALWVRQVAASSTGPPTWASHCCYCRRRHRSVCCRWEACRHKTTLTSLPTLGWVHPRAVGDCWHHFWATGRKKKL